ncbi:RFX DNA-binding domain-containing protein [Xylariaceae sp. FL0804]|nr:RFX DNA-binding domain-containing protein [Xylariaceae sp. FL0804]
MENGDLHPPDGGALSQPHFRRRPLSRASTASMHSISTQPTLEHSLSVSHNGAFQDQWNANDHGSLQQSQNISSAAPHMASQLSNGEMMSRPASRVQGSASIPMGPSLQPTVGSAMPVTYPPQIHGLPAHGLSTETFAPNNSFTEDSQMADREELDDGDALPLSAIGSRPASSRTSANNELEMRQLYRQNRHRLLEEVARELHGNERGPNSERTRQVFAMLWVSQVCSQGSGSVPRGRVYASYATRCATERITVLNPASFGKLVRVLFPGLKTRRLGVRGESKYHYVNFELADGRKEEPSGPPALPIAEPSSLARAFSTAPSQSPAEALNAPGQALLSPHLRPVQAAPATSKLGRDSSHSVYNLPDVSSIEQLQSTSKTVLRLSFAPEPEGSLSRQQPHVVLPPIEPYLPSGADPDSASILEALYRANITSLIESIRYCREKSFFHFVVSFMGTLTMPVQKILTYPTVAPWIEECDFIMYQRMMRIISGLTLQVVPKSVLDTLRSISERLVPRLRGAVQALPSHVLRAKEGPAALFAGLLDRALRVNLTAHAAANMLSNPGNRDQMYLDWITMVRIRKIAECVPTRGMDDLVKLLFSELRQLLDPVDVPWEIERQTLYGDLTLRDGDNASGAGIERGGDAENILDRWVQFLGSLPNRFPYASAADIVCCVQRVGTEAMRDLTIAQGKSFGSWWVTKCWIDEMISFLAEQGGLMQSRSTTSIIADPSQGGATATKNGSQHGSRLSSADMDMNVSQVSQAQPDTAPFPPRPEGQESMQSTNPDDSGIGIRTPEDDFPMEKFEFQAPRDQEELSSLGLDHVQ